MLAVFGCLLLLPVTPASAQTAGVEVVAEGLNNPRHLTFDDQDNLWIAEAGVGGTEDCISEGPMGGEFCFALTGSITRVDEQGQERVVTGLPSAITVATQEVVGPHDVSFDPDGNMFAVVGLGAAPVARADFGDIGEGFGQLYSVEAGTATAIVDIAAYETEQDPDAEQPGTEGPDSNPYGLLSETDSHLVVDAGGNDLLRVDAEGNISTVAVFEPQFVDAPPFLEQPEGTQIPMQAVPTSVVQGPDDAYYVSELTGFPFPVGASRVHRVVEGEAPEVVAEGFTNVVDLAFLPDGSLVVLELARDGLLSEQLEGQLVRIGPDGSRTRWLAGELNAPGGLAVGEDGALYISTCSVCPGEGQVLRFDPTPAPDPAIQDACPSESLPASQFADTGYNVHGGAIDCLAWWGISNGITPEMYAPASEVDRAQMAAFVARALGSAGVDLPADPPDAFGDDDFSVHEDSINELAALGVISGRDDGTYGPALDVSRAQTASLLVRAYELVSDSELEPAPNAFTDDEGNAHEESINQIAARGWTNGVAEGRYAPSRSLRRDQMASLIARMLDTLVEEELTSLPDLPA